MGIDELRVDGSTDSGVVDASSLPDVQVDDDSSVDAGFDAHVCTDAETRVVATCGASDLGQSTETCADNVWGLPVCIEDAPTATHGGWVHLRAEGRREPRATSDPLVSVQAFVELTWHAMTTSSPDPITAYHVFRAASPGGPGDFLAATADTRYRDEDVGAGDVFYYAVRPVVDVAPLVTTEVDSEIRVDVPPDNMVLVHRWIANQEVCGLLGESASVDRDSNYRCDYRGPGRLNYDGDVGEPPAADAYYDIGAHHFVDTVETGCNYTLSSAGCPDALGAPGVCLGVGDDVPSAAVNDKGGGLQVGVEGDVFYARTPGKCYYRNATGWVSSIIASPIEQAAMASSAPGLPPLNWIDQGGASSVCQSRGGDGSPTQLLSRKLQLAASAWDATESTDTIDAIEAGAAASDCNSDSGHALAFDDEAEPADSDTLPGTQVGTLRTLRTGAVGTSACVSRYGAQDLVGNVWEWVSDMCMSDDATSTCTGVASAFDPTNHDIQDVVIDEAMGAGADAWDLTDSQQCLPALGLPAATAAPDWYDARASASVEFHGDRIHVYANSATLRGAYAGGSATAGATGGRFAFNISERTTYTHPRVGFRCAARVR